VGAAFSHRACVLARLNRGNNLKNQQPFRSVIISLTAITDVVVFSALVDMNLWEIGLEGVCCRGPLPGLGLHSLALGV